MELYILLRGLRPAPRCATAPQLITVSYGRLLKAEQSSRRVPQHLLLVLHVGQPARQHVAGGP